MWPFNKRKKFSNAGTLAAPDADFLRALFGTETLSGATVTESTALGVATVFACVSLIADSISCLPLKLYRKTGNRREEIQGDRVADLVSTRPNPEQTSCDFRAAMQAGLSLYGNAYAKIARNRGGEPAELWPIHPGRVTVERDQNGLLQYRVSPQSGSRGTGTGTQVFRFNEILHIRGGISFSGTTSLNTFGLARECIGLAKTLEANAAKFFGQGSRPGLIIETATGMTEQQKQSMLDFIRKHHEGQENAYKTLLLAAGAKIQSLRADNTDSQFDESRYAQAIEVCQFFRVPPHKVGLLKQATFSNIEHQQIQWAQDTILPIAVGWEQALAGALLTIEQRTAGYYFKHRLDAIQRGDLASRYNAYAQGRQNGWLSANDVREMEDMDPIDGGDVYWTPVNMADAANPGPAAADPSNRLALTV